MVERFMYTVVPRKPIRNLIKGKVIFRSENLLLSKEEVALCLKHGAVYRKFYLENDPERVTLSNLDRLHRNIHLTEAQYKNLLEKESESNDTETVVEQSPIEEEANEELVEVEETSETTSTPVEQEIEETTEEKKEEEGQLPTETDPLTEDSVEENEEVEEPVKVNNSNNSAKKKNRKKSNSNNRPPQTVTENEDIIM